MVLVNCCAIHALRKMIMTRANISTKKITLTYKIYINREQIPYIYIPYAMIKVGAVESVYPKLHLRSLAAPLQKPYLTKI